MCLRAVSVSVCVRISTRVYALSPRCCLSIWRRVGLCVQVRLDQCGLMGRNTLHVLALRLSAVRLGKYRRMRVPAGLGDACVGRGTCVCVHMCTVPAELPSRTGPPVCRAAVPEPGVQLSRGQLHGVRRRQRHPQVPPPPHLRDSEDHPVRLFTFLRGSQSSPAGAAWSLSLRRGGEGHGLWAWLPVWASVSPSAKWVEE